MKLKAEKGLRNRFRRAGPAPSRGSGAGTRLLQIRIRIGEFPASRRFGLNGSLSGQGGVFPFDGHGACLIGRGHAKIFVDIGFHAGTQIRVLVKELADVFASLAEFFPAIGKPGSALIDDFAFDAVVDKLAGPGNSVTVDNVEGGHLEGRGHLVLDDLDLVDWNLLLTIINLLLLFVLMRIFLFKPVQKIIAARQEEADRQFKEAGESKQAAEEARKPYEASLPNAEEAKKQVLQEARQTADAEYKRIVSDAEKTAKQVKEDAITDAENQKAQILKKAEKDIADMVVDATVKIVGEKKGADVDNALYDKFLDKAGDET